MIPSSQPTNKTGFEIEVIQTIVAKTVNNITMAMVKTLMSGLQEKIDFKQLAEKHINVKLEEELSEVDDKCRMVYKKVFAATNEHIQKNSPPLTTTFVMMEAQTGDNKTAGLFLGSFVLPAVKEMVETLKKEHPEALEDPEIWL